MAASASSLGALEIFYTAFKSITTGLKRIENADTSFRRAWKLQWTLASERVAACADVNSSASSIALMSPSIEQVCNLVGDLKWNAAALTCAKILFVDQDSTVAWLSGIFEPILNWFVKQLNLLGDSHHLKH